jgi:hypothetical protein
LYYDANFSLIRFICYFFIELKAASQLLCSLCKEEGGAGTYYSAYQLLAHIFLSHRSTSPLFPATKPKSKPACEVI